MIPRFARLRRHFLTPAQLQSATGQTDWPSLPLERSTLLILIGHLFAAHLAIALPVLLQRFSSFTCWPCIAGLAVWRATIIRRGGPARHWDRGNWVLLIASTALLVPAVLSPTHGSWCSLFALFLAALLVGRSTRTDSPPVSHFVLASPWLLLAGLPEGLSVQLRTIVADITIPDAPKYQSDFFVNGLFPESLDILWLLSITVILGRRSTLQVFASLVPITVLAISVAVAVFLITETGNSLNIPPQSLIAVLSCCLITISPVLILIEDMISRRLRPAGFSFATVNATGFQPALRYRQFPADRGPDDADSRYDLLLLSRISLTLSPVAALIALLGIGFASR